MPNTIQTTCPYCLKVLPTQETNPCPSCKTKIPTSYIAKTGIPKPIVGVIGFSGHGKTVYLTSLFSVLARCSDWSNQPSEWNGYFFRSLDDYTHKILYQHVPDFDKGILPESTPANFPSPALISCEKLPIFKQGILSLYDVAGEIFTDSQQITKAGSFVAHAQVALFILSLHDLDNNNLDLEMSKLLDTYITAVYEKMQIDIKEKQTLIVILTKADIILEKLPKDLRLWVEVGSTEWYLNDLAGKIAEVQITSVEIQGWLQNTLNCNRFINLANNHFKQVFYSLVSATGVPEIEGVNNHYLDELPSRTMAYNPSRVLDPFWLILQSAPIHVHTNKATQKSLMTRIAEKWRHFRLAMHKE